MSGLTVYNTHQARHMAKHLEDKKMNAITIQTAQNTTGDWLNIQSTDAGYRVIGQRINYIRGKNVVKWVIVKDKLTLADAKKLFNQKVVGKRV